MIFFRRIRPLELLFIFLEPGNTLTGWQREWLTREWLALRCFGSTFLPLLFLHTQCLLQVQPFRVSFLISY